MHNDLVNKSWQMYTWIKKKEKIISEQLIEDTN